MPGRCRRSSRNRAWRCRPRSAATPWATSSADDEPGGDEKAHCAGEPAQELRRQLADHAHAQVAAQDGDALPGAEVAAVDRDEEGGDEDGGPAALARWAFAPHEASDQRLDQEQ